MPQQQHWTTEPERVVLLPNYGFSVFSSVKPLLSILMIRQHVVDSLPCVVQGFVQLEKLVDQFRIELGSRMFVQVLHRTLVKI